MPRALRAAYACPSLASLLTLGLAAPHTPRPQAVAIAAAGALVVAVVTWFGPPGSSVAAVVANGEAEDGAQAVALARQRAASLVLMDIRMPRMDGLEATRRLAGPDVGDPIDVVVLTTFDLDDYVFGALQAGAAGFLLKDAEPEAIFSAIRTVAAGNGLIAPADHALRRGLAGRRPPAGARRAERA